MEAVEGLVEILMGRRSEETCSARNVFSATVTQLSTSNTHRFDP